MLIHEHLLKFKDTQKSLWDQSSFETYSEKTVNIHESKGRPQIQHEPHADEPSGCPEQDEGPKPPSAPESSGTTQNPNISFANGALSLKGAQTIASANTRRVLTANTKGPCSYTQHPQAFILVPHDRKENQTSPGYFFFYATKTLFSWSCLSCFNNKEGICFVIPPINQFRIWFTETGKRGSWAHWRVVKTSLPNFTFLHSNLQTKLSSRLTCHLQQQASAIKHIQSLLFRG